MTESENATTWRAVGDGAFAPPFGTIRQCLDCGCLVGGGTTRCSRCARDGGSERPTPEKAPCEASAECPACGSPKPHLHPAVQAGGECGVCPDPFHRRVTAENTIERIARVNLQAPVSGGLDPRIAKASKLLDDICIDVAFRADESLWARSNEVREMLSEVLVSAQQPAPQASDIKQLRFHLTEALYVVKRGDQLEYAVKSIETALAVLASTPPAEPGELHCSFCRKTPRDVKTLVCAGKVVSGEQSSAGPAICNECVTAAARKLVALSDGIEEPVPDLRVALKCSGCEDCGGTAAPCPHEEPSSSAVLRQHAAAVERRELEALAEFDEATARIASLEAELADMTRLKLSFEKLYLDATHVAESTAAERDVAVARVRELQRDFDAADADLDRALSKVKAWEATEADGRALASLAADHSGGFHEHRNIVARRYIAAIPKLAPDCELCARGFPLENGAHYGTQALGMIPTTACLAAVDRAKADSSPALETPGEPWTPQSGEMVRVKTSGFVGEALLSALGAIFVRGSTRGLPYDAGEIEPAVPVEPPAPASEAPLVEQREEEWTPKVGDRVRVKANCSVRGLLGEVSRVNGASVRVILDEREVTHVFVSSDVEPAPPAPPPSPGVDVPRALELVAELTRESALSGYEYRLTEIVRALGGEP